MACLRILFAQLNLQEGASQEELRKSYRKLALQCHPDKLNKKKNFHFRGKTELKNAQTPTDFIKIREAYEILSDDVKRSDYIARQEREEREKNQDDSTAPAPPGTLHLPWFGCSFRDEFHSWIQGYHEKHKEASNENENCKNFEGNLCSPNWDCLFNFPVLSVSPKTTSWYFGFFEMMKNQVLQMNALQRNSLRLNLLDFYPSFELVNVWLKEAQTEIPFPELCSFCVFLHAKKEKEEKQKEFTQKKTQAFFNSIEGLISLLPDPTQKESLSPVQKESAKRKYETQFETSFATLKEPIWKCFVKWKQEIKNTLDDLICTQEVNPLEFRFILILFQKNLKCFNIETEWRTYLWRYIFQTSLIWEVNKNENDENEILQIKKWILLQVFCLHQLGKCSTSGFSFEVSVNLLEWCLIELLNPIWFSFNATKSVHACFAFLLLQRWVKGRHDEIRFALIHKLIQHKNYPALSFYLSINSRFSDFLSQQQPKEQKREMKENPSFKIESSFEFLLIHLNEEWNVVRKYKTQNPLWKEMQRWMNRLFSRGEIRLAIYVYSFLSFFHRVNQTTIQSADFWSQCAQIQIRQKKKIETSALASVYWIWAWESTAEKILQKQDKIPQNLYFLYQAIQTQLETLKTPVELKTNNEASNFISLTLLTCMSYFDQDPLLFHCTAFICLEYHEDIFFSNSNFVIPIEDRNVTSMLCKKEIIYSIREILETPNRLDKLTPTSKLRQQATQLVVQEMKKELKSLKLAIAEQDWMFLCDWFWVMWQVHSFGWFNWNQQERDKSDLIEIFLNNFLMSFQNNCQQNNFAQNLVQALFYLVQSGKDDTKDKKTHWKHWHKAQDLLFQLLCNFPSCVPLRQLMSRFGCDPQWRQKMYFFETCWIQTIFSEKPTYRSDDFLPTPTLSPPRYCGSYQYKTQNLHKLFHYERAIKALYPSTTNSYDFALMYYEWASLLETSEDFVSGGAIIESKLACAWSLLMEIKSFGVVSKQEVKQNKERSKRCVISLQQGIKRCVLEIIGIATSSPVWTYKFSLLQLAHLLACLRSVLLLNAFPVLNDFPLMTHELFQWIIDAQRILWFPFVFPRLCFQAISDQVYEELIWKQCIGPYWTALDKYFCQKIRIEEISEKRKEKADFKYQIWQSHFQSWIQDCNFEFSSQESNPPGTETKKNFTQQIQLARYESFIAFLQFRNVSLEECEQKWMGFLKNNLRPPKNLNPKSPTFFSRFVNWTRPTTSWSVFGVEIHQTKPLVKLILKPCNGCEGSGLSNQDISEWMRFGSSFACFTLDEADVEKKFHPCQAARFAPSQLQNTQFLQDLFHADYLLKAFTTGSWFEGNSLETQVAAIDSPYFSHLTSEEKKKFFFSYTDPTLAPDTNFKLEGEMKKSSKGEEGKQLELISNFSPEIETKEEDVKECEIGQSHRFWIECDPIPVLDCSDSKASILSYHFMDLHSHIKTHLLEKNKEGKYVDAPNSTSTKDQKGKKEQAYAQELTLHYGELKKRFPVFAKLEEHFKLCAVRTLLIAYKQTLHIGKKQKETSDTLDQYMASVGFAWNSAPSASLTFGGYVPSLFRKEISPKGSLLRFVFGGVHLSGQVTEMKTFSSTQIINDKNLINTPLSQFAPTSTSIVVASESHQGYVFNQELRKSKHGRPCVDGAQTMQWNGQTIHLAAPTGDHTQLGCHKKGYAQARTFSLQPSGRWTPVCDYDFSNHNTESHPNPHKHVWTEVHPQTYKRGPPENL